MSKYQYSYVELEYVMSNPDEYIIDDCQGACRLLWDKNIETFMVSNNDDDFLYVLIGDLSDENLEIMKEKIKENPNNYFYSNDRGCYGIRVAGLGEKNKAELEKLTEVFMMQDTFRFLSTEQFLKNYKTTDGKYEMDPETFAFYRKENPKLANATLEEALEKTGKKSLYIEEEGRVYDSETYLKWHKRYLKYKEMNDILKSEDKNIEIGEKTDEIQMT